MKKKQTLTDEELDRLIDEDIVELQKELNVLVNDCVEKIIRIDTRQEKGKHRATNERLSSSPAAQNPLPPPTTVSSI
jgi:hypothetical protein